MRVPNLLQVVQVIFLNGIYSCTCCHFASSDFFLMLSTQQLKESFHKFWQSTPHTSSCVLEHIFASLRATGQTSKSTDNEGHDRAGCVHIK